MSKHDTFISYAAEDNDFATEVAYGLRANGLSVWFAPLSLKAGERLLDSIEQGMEQSRTGTLVVSPAYLCKGWTGHEMDVLIRDNIERGKVLLPIWLNTSKAEIEAKHRSLSSIVAITDTSSVSQVVAKLVEALSGGAPSRGVVPSWEHPTYRFLQGRGEVNLQSDVGPSTTIFEFLLHSDDSRYPFWVGGQVFTKRELLLHVAQLLAHTPDLVRSWVCEEEFKRLWEMCVDANLDPTMM